MACAQRGWNGQPAGTSSALGGSPGKAAPGSVAVGSIIGIAASNAWV
jgi:hypothetical protein